MRFREDLQSDRFRWAKKTGGRIPISAAAGIAVFLEN
jgi:hypothetical protein